ncbi:hypothetical protein P154DRAFT_448419, partial [Amniculicola lignicola CBS 123094]
LLIFNSYKSYYLLNFQELCKENNIFTLYILPYLLHLLQLLNIGYFSPLKRAYRQPIDNLLALLDNAMPIKKERFITYYY